MPFSHSNGHIITILYIELELGFGLTLSSLQSLLIAGSHSTKAYFSDLKQEIPKQKNIRFQMNIFALPEITN